MFFLTYKKLPKYFFSISFLIYFIYAAISTYPLIFNLDKTAGNLVGDVFVYAWNIDTFWERLASFNNPFYTNRILYPLGTSLVFHTYAPLVSLGGLFFRHQLISYLNFVLIISFALSSLSAEILAYHISKNRPASFIAGLIYGFSPVMFSFFESQHYYFATAAIFIPLEILWIFKFFQNFQRRYLILIIITFLLCFLTDYYSTVLLLLSSAITTGVILVSKVRRNLMKVFILSGILFIFLTFLSTVRLDNPATWPERKLWYADFCHTNIAGFFIPSTRNPVLGPLGSSLHRLFSVEQNLDTPSYFWGWFTIFFIFFMARKIFHRREAAVALLILGTVFLLSLGTSIKIGPKTLLSGQTTLFYWFGQIPFLDLVDCPLRFPVVIQLSLSILAALSISYLLERLHSRQKIIFLILFLIIFLIEYGNIGLPLSSISIPEVYQKLSFINSQKTLLELPSGLAESKGAFGYDWSINNLQSKQMYWQTIHSNPRIGAYISRISPETYNFFKTQSVISDLFSMTSLNGNLPLKIYTKEEINQFINRFNLGFIILSPNPRQKQFAGVIDSWFKDFIQEKLAQENYVLYQIK